MAPSKGQRKGPYAWLLVRVRERILSMAPSKGQRKGPYAWLLVRVRERVLMHGS